MRKRIYEWHLKIALAFTALTAEQAAEFEIWQAAHPQEPDCDWPEIQAIVGPHPSERPVLVFSREKTA